MIDDNKVRITNFFFELTDNDGQNFLAGIVRKCMWQLCEWDRFDICMTFYKRAFNFLIPLHIDLTTFKIAT
jgi:hypothetical protein